MQVDGGPERSTVAWSLHDGVVGAGDGCGGESPNHASHGVAFHMTCIVWTYSTAAASTGDSTVHSPLFSILRIRKRKMHFICPFRFPL